MSKKSKPNKDGIVFSTNPYFSLDEEHQDEVTLAQSQQKLKVRLDTKRRAGKVVTLIEGFVGKDEDLEDLGKKLKTFCGTGGSVKDREIIIQGDQRDKVIQWLQKNEYKSVKKI